jgi:hypothetical protein
MRILSNLLQQSEWASRWKSNFQWKKYDKRLAAANQSPSGGGLNHAAFLGRFRGNNPANTSMDVQALPYRVIKELPKSPVPVMPPFETAFHTAEKATHSNVAELAVRHWPAGRQVVQNLGRRAKVEEFELRCKVVPEPAAAQVVRQKRT